MVDIVSQNRLRLAEAKKSSQPLTGIYWWIPNPPRTMRSKCTWTVLPFYAADRKHDVQHVEQWPQVTEFLSSIWKKKLQKAEYASLPRGRINYPYKINHPVLYHGNNSPGNLDLVKKAFNLPPDTKAAYDCHERIIPLEYQELISLLEFDLGLETLSGRRSLR